VNQDYCGEGRDQSRSHRVPHRSPIGPPLIPRIPHRALRRGAVASSSKPLWTASAKKLLAPKSNPRKLWSTHSSCITHAASSVLSTLPSMHLNAMRWWSMARRDSSHDDEACMQQVLLTWSPAPSFHQQPTFCPQRIKI
jgi:hypothetical protein